MTWCLALGAASLSAAFAADPPPFDEVYGLVRSNLVGTSAAELNRAAVEGFVSQLSPRVTLAADPGTSPQAGSTNTGIAGDRTFDRTLGYLRLEEICPRAAEAFPGALESLNDRGRLEGLVLDLRFARGTDYAAAGRLADTFVADARPLLKWGEETWQSTGKTNAFRRPVVVLVNHETRGAAEALAAALRHADAALLLGSATAGEASVYREFPLSTGQRLQVASTPVRTGDGHEIPPGGVKPDIEVAVRVEDERLFLADPYRQIGRQSTLVRRGATNAPSAAAARPTRINEADLVRMKREGLPADDESPVSARPSSTTPAVVNDPALARALDLLKGLTLLKSRP